MDFKTFEKELYNWFAPRLVKAKGNDNDYDEDTTCMAFFLEQAYRGVIFNVFEGQTIEDTCQRLLADIDALEQYFIVAFSCMNYPKE